MKDDLHGPGQRAPERADKLGQDGEDGLPVSLPAGSAGSLFDFRMIAD